MALRIIDCVVKRLHVNVRRLGRISEATASTVDGLSVNHEYQDLRGLTLEDLNDILEFETEAFNKLQLQNFNDVTIEEVEEEWVDSFLLPGIDFGVGSTVAALSVLGCVPITSCRGRTLDDSHRNEAPTVCFYSSPDIVPLLIELAKASRVSLENNLDQIELYTDDLRLCPILGERS